MGRSSQTHPFLAQFQHDVDIIVIIKETMESNNISMVQRLMDLNFLGHFGLLIMLHHQFLGYNFSGISLVRGNIDYFVAFCKSTLFLNARVNLFGYFSSFCTKKKPAGKKGGKKDLIKF
jgi:hypothetical protein